MLKIYKDNLENIYWVVGLLIKNKKIAIFSSPDGGAFKFEESVEAFERAAEHRPTDVKLQIKIDEDK